jgi:hypothetical protein
MRRVRNARVSVSCFDLFATSGTPTRSVPGFLAGATVSAAPRASLVSLASLIVLVNSRGSAAAVNPAGTSNNAASSFTTANSVTSIDDSTGFASLSARSVIDVV